MKRGLRVGFLDPCRSNRLHHFDDMNLDLAKLHTSNLQAPGWNIAFSRAEIEHIVFFEKHPLLVRPLMNRPPPTNLPTILLNIHES